MMSLVIIPKKVVTNYYVLITNKSLCFIKNFNGISTNL